MENNKFGIIIHYGLYSYYGYDNLDNVKRRKIQNGSEWYYGRLICNSTFRPISGSKYTKEYHHKNYNDIDYFSNLDKLINDESKIRNWVKVAKENGASYIILTSKHHDGVCLWNTLTTDRKSNMDICKILSDECKQQNMEFGFYYSWFEFDKPFTLEYFNRYCVKQIDELLQYEPNYMWFDGDWKISQKKIINLVKGIVENLINKHILVNDRIHKENWNLYHQHNKMLEKKYLPNPLKCHIDLLNVRDEKDFKDGLIHSLWNCDMCSYSLKPEDIKIYDDEDLWFTIIEFVLSDEE
jgi:hypothetical protein